jgi:hypothetical protein
MFYKIFLKRKRLSLGCFFVIEVGCYFSWVVQIIKDYKFMGPLFLHYNFKKKCIGCVKPSKIRMMVSNVMAKLKFDYLLKQNLFVCDNLFFFFILFV